MRKIENLNIKTMLNKLNNYYNFIEFTNQISHFLNIEFKDNNGREIDIHNKENQTLIINQIVELASNKSNKLIILYLLFHQISLFVEDEFVKLESKEVLSFWKVLFLP